MKAKNYMKKFGSVVPMTEIDTQREWAEIFSEGNEALRNLLLYVWANNIPTVACCTGHDEKYEYYYKKRFMLPAKQISKEEYLKNCNKRNYHYYLIDRTGYFSFVANEKIKIKTIEKHLKKQGLNFNITKNSFEKSFAIYNKGSNKDANLFFETIQKGIEECLI